MNKKYIYWGLGLIAVGGLAYYFMSGKKSESAKSLGSGSSASNTSSNDASNSTSTDTTAPTETDPVLGHTINAGGSLHQRRVNCRVEARNRGLKGKAKRDFRRDCRKSGGYDDGLESFDGEDSFMASGNSGGGCTTANGMVGSFQMVAQGTFPETYKRTCVSRGFRDRA